MSPLPPSSFIFFFIIIILHITVHDWRAHFVVCTRSNRLKTFSFDVSTTLRTFSFNRQMIYLSV